MANFYEVLTHLRDPESIRAKIWERSIPEPNSGCWLWLGATKGRGYGHLHIDRKFVGAHRASFIAYNGPLSEYERALHTCDNPLCVNPDHLKPGTSQQNTDDCKRRGRFRTGRVGRTRPPLTQEEKERICAEPRVRGSGRKLAAEMGLTEGTVSRLRNSK